MKNKLLILSIIIIILTIALSGCIGGEPIVKEILIAESPRLTYVKGQEFELGNAKLRVVFDDGSEEMIAINKFMISSFDPNLVGEQYLNITYRGKNVHITVIVLEENIVNISMETLPNKLSYIEEQNLNLKGATIKINYENGEPTILPLTEEMVSGYNPKKIGEQNITVSYKEFHTFFKVSVSEKVLTGVELATSPSKKIYYLREELDVVGGSIRLSYNNNYPVIINLSELSKENFIYDFSKESARAIVKILYKGFETSFAVEVKEKDADSFEIIKNTEIRQLINKDLDFSGMQIKVNYNNGSNEIFEFPNEEVEFAFAFGYDNVTPGVKKLVFTFPSIIKKLYMDVELFDKTAIELLIVQPLNEKIYQDNYVDLANWKYRIKYDNGEITDERVMMSTMLVDPFGNALYCENGGKKTLSFKLDDLKTDFTFDVIDKEIVAIKVLNDFNYKQLLGIDLNTDGLKLEVTYNDGNKNKNDIFLTPSMVLNYDKNFLGEQNVKIRFGDRFTDEFIFDYKILTIKVSSNIELNQDLNYKNYKLYDELNLSGLKIKVNFEDAEPIIISEIGADFFITSEGFKDNTMQFIKTGTYDIKIRYIGIPENVDSIIKITVTVTNLLTKIAIVDLDGNEIESFDSIAQGLEINYSNYRLRKTYQSTEEIVAITKDMLNYRREDLTEGERNIILSYGEGDINLSRTYTINILKKEPLSINIFNLPNKTVYPIDDQGLIIDLTGLAIRINYNNATQEVVYYNWENQSSFEITLNEISESRVKVLLKYFIKNYGYETEFEVRRSSEAISSITYEDGRNFTIANISQDSNAVDLATILELVLLNDTQKIGETTLLISYVSGRTETATINDMFANNSDKFAISNKYFAQNSSTELKIIEIYYDGIAFKMAFYVIPTQLVSIEYFSSMDADKIRVKEGQDVDLSTQKYFLNLHFENAKTIIAPILQSNLIRSNDNPSGYDKTNTVAGTRSVQLIYFYNGVKYVCTTNIEVLEKEMQSIDINIAPKIKYVEGDSFTILVDDKNTSKGYGSITINYDNGTILNKSLQSADINNENSSFNINTINFNSIEFSGNTRNQTIYINYREKGVQKTCTYDIYVSDRKNPIINYHSSNIYNFTYGEVVVPGFDVLGYANLSDTNPTKQLDVTITYKNKNDVNAQETSVLPTDVGRYTIIIRYVSNLLDRENNDFMDNSKEIVISAKDIYVKAKDMSSIYGQLHSENYIFYASRYPNLKYEDAILPENNPFAYNDHFDSANFRDLSQDLTIIMNGTLNSTLSAGTYKIKPNNCISKNYRILYAESDYVINKREVVILPNSMNYVYGQFNFNIPYKTLQKYENGTYVTASGLVGGDKLGGALGYGENSPLEAGVYQVNIGSLNNPNYNIIFNDFLETQKEDYYVTIAPRKIYIKADNISIVYGQVRPKYSIQFYSNEICTITDGAFVFDQTPAIVFGERKIVFTVNEELHVGKYNVSIEFDSPYVGNYEVVFIDSTIVVTARNIEIEITEHFKYYGEITPNIIYNIINQTENSGLLEGEKLSGKVGIYNLNENVGTYSYDISNLRLENPNYNIIYKPTSLFIIKESEIEIVLDEQYLLKTYDGKLPFISLDNLKFINKSTNTAILDNDVINTLKESIVIDFIGKKKDANKYPLLVQNFNYNYKITFASSYSYEILPRTVEIIYQVLNNTTGKFVEITEENNSAIFRGSEFKFNAIVSPNSIMPIYYENGEIVVGQYDTVIATMLRDNYTDVNSKPYKLTAIGLNNNNYILPSEGSYCEFKINPYVINVKFNTNASEKNESGSLKYDVISKEYAFNRFARIDSKDFEILNTDNVPWQTKPNLTFIVKNFDPNKGTPSDVEKDSNDKYIDHYIEFNELSFNNENYIVNIEKGEAEETPRYRILPRKVLIYIYGHSLSKRYDGEPPRIMQNAFYTNPDIEKSGVQFTFDNMQTEVAKSDVGEYKLGVFCRDLNYDVSFTENADIKYSILELESKFVIQNAATSKIYNGKVPSIERNQISVDNAPTGFNTINTYTNEEFEAAKTSDRKYSIIFNFSSGASKNVGEYAFEIWDNDKNVEYKFENNQTKYNYQIKPKDIEILFNNNEDIEKVYGEAEIDINKLWRYVNGKEPILEEELKFSVSRRLNNPNNIMDRTNYNVGRYLISLDIDADSEINKNYNIRYNVTRDIYYVINKATIYVKISDNIGEGKDEFIYGNNRNLAAFVSMDNLAYYVNNEYPQNILRKYLPESNIEVDTFNNAVSIDISTMELTDRENLLNSKLDAGIYDVHFYGGILSANYSIEVLKGKAEISKRALTVSNTQFIDGKSLISRLYGDSGINLSFSGLAVNDTIVKNNNNYYINNVINDKFFMPEIIDITSSALNPNTDAGDTIYDIRLKENIINGSNFTSKNYYLNLDSEESQNYGVRINKAPLNYGVVTMTNTSLSKISPLSKVYGDRMELGTNYKYLFEGFKNEQTISSLGLNLPLIDHAYSAGELNIVIDPNAWGDQFENELKNYVVSYVPNKLSISKAKLKVEIDREVQFMYEYAATGVPYKFLYQGDVTEQNSYFNYNLKYTGLKSVNPDNPDLIDSYLDVFNSVAESAYPKHTIRINQYNDNRKIYGTNVISIEIDGEAIKNDGNYEIETELGNCLINIEIKGIKVSESFKGIGSSFKAEDVLLDITLKNDEVVKYKLSEIPEYIAGINKGLSFETLQESYNLNTNYPISILYNAEFSLPRQNGASGTSDNEIVKFNGKFGSTLRIYSTETMTNDIELTNQGNGKALVKGAKLASIDNTVNYLNNGSFSYDTIDLSFLMTATNNNSKFELLINGNETNNIKLVIGKNLYSAGYVYFEINYGGTKDIVTIPLANIDFFDGYVHDVKIYFEKQFNRIAVSIDGNMSDSVYTITPNVNYIISENSIANFNIGGLNCYIKDIKYSQRGIYDNADTSAKPNGIKYENNVIVNNTTIYVESDAFTEKVFTVAEFFTTTKDYEQRFYLNGKAVETYTFTNTGIYELKTELVDNGTVFDTKVIYLTIATMQVGKIDDQSISFTSPYDMYGYEISESATSDLITNGAKELTQKVQWNEQATKNSKKVNVVAQIQKSNNGLAAPLYYLDYALMTLKTNGDLNNAYNRTEEGINSVSIVVTNTGLVANSFNSYLYIALGTKQYSLNLGSINWKDDVTEVELYTDYSDESSDISMTLNIYSNGKLSKTFKINEKTNFNGGTLSVENMIEICKLPTNANFSVKGGKMSIARIVSNEVNTNDNSYLVNDNFVMDLGEGVPVNMGSTLKIANSKEQPILVPSNNIIIKLKNNIGTGENYNLDLQLLSQDGKEIRFKFSKTKISFAFTKDAFRGLEQTFNISTSVQSFSTIRLQYNGKRMLPAGSLTNVDTLAVSYKVFLNNNAITEFYLPYADSTTNWYGNGEHSAVNNNAKTFLPYFISPTLTVNGYNNVIVTRFDARSGAIAI